MSYRRKVLVLGERAIAKMISQQLEAMGLEPIQERPLGRQLPKLSDPDFLVKTRQFLAEFAKISGEGGMVHPGPTPWAERAELPCIAEELGLVWIGPSARVLSFFNNKLNLLMNAERHGIPNLVLSFDPIHTVREIEDFVLRLGQGFPFVLRAVKRGGSLGVFLVQDADSLGKIPSWLDQLRETHGEVLFFAERYLESSRYVMVPFARFRDGEVVIFPTTDASLQSQHRKLVELAPAVQLEKNVLEQLESWTRHLAEQWGYVGVGALAYLVDGSRAFLVDGMARLNTSFHLWERVAGTLAVAWQMAILEGGPPASKRRPSILPAQEWGNGIFLRILAEDSRFQLPQPGEIFEMAKPQSWSFPGADAKMVLNYESGEKVSPFDLGLVGMVWVFSQNRKQLFPLAQGVLREFSVVGSVQTNELFLSELLTHPWVKEEIFHTGFVEEEFLPAVFPPQDLLPLFVSILLSHPNLGMDQSQLNRGTWWVGSQGMKLDPSFFNSPSWVGRPRYWTSTQDPDPRSCGVAGYVRVEGDVVLKVSAFPLPSFLHNRWLVRVGMWCLTVRWLLNKDPSNQNLAKKTLALSALVTGRVHAILFREGALVPAREPVLMIESLGVFIPHALPFNARVVSWKVTAEAHVSFGQRLAEIEVYKSGQ